jgi:hypothetical protein
MRPYDVDKGVATGQDAPTTVGGQGAIAIRPYMMTRIIRHDFPLRECRQFNKLTAALRMAEGRRPPLRSKSVHPNSATSTG